MVAYSTFFGKPRSAISLNTPLISCLNCNSILQWTILTSKLYAPFNCFDLLTHPDNNALQWNGILAYCTELTDALACRFGDVADESYRGVTRVETGEQFPGRRKLPTMSQVLQYSRFASEIPQVASNLLLPWAPSNLVPPLVSYRNTVFAHKSVTLYSVQSVR